MNIIQTLIDGTIGTMLGVIIGFALSEWAAKRRDQRERDRRNQSSRAIMVLEIDMNIKTLSEFWENLINELKDEKNQRVETNKRKLAKKFIEQPFAPFSKKAFESQLSNMADALGSLEVLQVFQFYDRLNELEAIREKLQYLMQLQTDEFRHATSESKSGGLSRVFKYAPSEPFNDQSVKLWNESASLVAQIRAKGNPLKRN